MRYKCNNKGVTLIELILVFALVAITITISTFSYGAVSRANVQKAGNAYAEAIELARNTAMAKGPERGLMHVTVKSDGTMSYYIGTDATKAENICQSPIKAQTLAGGNLPSSFTVAFNTAGMIDGTDTSFTKIRFIRGKKVCNVEVNKLTGKCEIETKVLP